MPSARFDAIASTQPRIKRDVLFTETPDGVLFHNSDGGFRLKAKAAYRFATLLVPHLNGAHTVADLCQDMNDRQKEMVGELVSTLYDRGFARAVLSDREPGSSIGSEPDKEVARRFSAQIAYIDHYADDAGRRFQKFRDARVIVIGEDSVARWCVLSLVRNGSAAVGVLPTLDRRGVDEAVLEARADGCPVDVHELSTSTLSSQPLDWSGLGNYDVVVITGGAEAPGRLLPLLRNGVPAGRLLLPAWSFGDRTVVGPSMSAGMSGCWACAALRMGANDGAAEAADLWSSLALTSVGSASARCAESGGPAQKSAPGQPAEPGRPMAAMLGNLLGYEVFRLVTGALPAETTGKVIIQDVHSLDVTSEVLLPHPCCPICAAAGDAPDCEIRLPEAQRGIDDVSGLPTLANAREADALIDELNRRSVLLQERTGVFTRFDDEAIVQTPIKLSVVELGLGHGRPRRVAAADIHHVAGARTRALYRAAEAYTEHVAPHRGSVKPDGSVCVAPEQLSIYAGSGDAAEVRGWTVASSLLTGERLLVPVESVRTLGAGNRARLFEVTCAGTRAGASVEGAAADGLLSALAYDALQLAVRGHGAARMTLDAVTDPELIFLVRSARNLGVEWELLDLGEQDRSGVTAVLARSDTRWALAADLTRQAAASAALRDLLGEMQAVQQGIREGFSFGDPVLPDLEPHAIPVTTTVPFAGTNAPSWADVMRRLGGQGRDALVVPTGSEDLALAGIHVAKVLLTTEALSAR
ncbi:TOMM precursor leader peptide-binding protein [Streptomyces sp. NPDC055794]